VIGLPVFIRRARIVDTLEVRSIQLFGFVAIVFLITCYIGSTISRRFEVKEEEGG